MDKALREKIAQAIYDKWNFSKPKDRLEVAETILALLPPMLTKDEARCLLSCAKCSYSFGMEDCQKRQESLNAKLKMIQEGE